jgi:PAS domain S-box-containing protein
MKIRTTLLLSLGIFALILVIIFASVISTSQQVNRLNEQEQIASSVEKGANDLGFLSNEYLLYREDLQRDRWNAKYNAISDLLAGLSPDQPEQKVLVESIRTNQERLHTVFSEIVSAQDASPAGTDPGVDPAFLQVSWSRLAVQEQSMITDASQLVNLLEQEKEQASQTNILLITSLMGAFLAFLVTEHFLVNRRTLKSISELRKAAEEIGAGNLDISLPAERDDEIGDLAHSFNRMASDLQKVTASKADLEREIAVSTKIEHALRVSEEKFRTVADFTSGWEYWMGPDQRLVYISPSCEKITGYNQAEFTARPVLIEEIVHPQDRELVHRHESREDRGITTESIDFRIVHRDGSLRWIGHQCQQVFSEDGRLLGRRVSNRDITDRKNREELLARQAALLDLANDVIFVKDLDDRIVSWNAGGEAKYGWKEEEVIGKKAYELLQTRFPVPWRQILEQIFATGRWEGELVNTTRNGETLTMNSRLSLQRDHEGRPVVILESQSDITPLQEYAVNLSRSNKELEQFAYVASHDLREPLRMVTSFSQLLQQKYQGRLDADADEFIGYIVDGAARMDALIQDLLEYSRVSSRAKPFGPTDMGVVMDHVRQNVAVLIRENGAEVTSGPLPVIIADQSQMVQVMQNLVANAIIYRTDEPPRIRVEAREKGQEWIFSVHDNGIGIDPAYFDKIFELFQRLHSREQYPGTGIGLAICRRIVERHGGRIWVESEQGKGSTFFFSIPLREEVIRSPERENTPAI